MPGTFPPPWRVSDPDMHHGTCVTHMPWCMPGSLTSGLFEIGGEESFPGIPGACTSRIFTYLVKGPCNVIAPHQNAKGSWCHCALKIKPCNCYIVNTMAAGCWVKQSHSSFIKIGMDSQISLHIHKTLYSKTNHRSVNSDITEHNIFDRLRWQTTYHA